jgi:hypothetical protein
LLRMSSDDPKWGKYHYCLWDWIVDEFLRKPNLQMLSVRKPYSPIREHHRSNNIHFR